MTLGSRELYERFGQWVLGRPGGSEDFLAFVREVVWPNPPYDAGIGRADAAKLDRIASWAVSTRHGEAAAEVIRILNNGQEPMEHGAPEPEKCLHCLHRVDHHTARVGEDTGVCASCSCMSPGHRWETSILRGADVCVVPGCSITRLPSVVDL